MYEYNPSFQERCFNVAVAILMCLVLVVAIVGTALFLTKIPELSDAWSRNLAEPRPCAPAPREER